MQSPILYQAYRAVPVDGYLPGQAQWSVAVRLTGVRAQYAGGQTLRFDLDVDGVPSGPGFTTDGSEPRVVHALGVVVSAGAVVRWRVAFAGAAWEAPDNVLVTLEWEPYLAVPAPAMQLDWQEGGNRLTLFAYDPATQSFSDVSGGLAAGRAAVDTSDGLSFFIGGTEILRCRSGVVSGSAWREGSAPDPSVPRLSFTVNGVPWLTLNGAGVYAGNLVEAGALPAADYYFDLGPARVLAAGFYALQLVEGVS